MCGRDDVVVGTVEMIVVALCADYDRRSKAISERSVNHRTEMEYRYLNFKLLEGAEEIVGEYDAPMMIEDIGIRRGYAKSDLYYYSEKSYKMKKQQIKNNIARKLHLID